MRAPALAVVATLIALLVAATVAGPVAGQTDGTEGAEPAVTLGVDVHESGDAVWTVTARYGLADGNETAAFDDLLEAYRLNETDDGPQVGTFRTLAERAAERTGREMTVEVLGRSGKVRNRSAVADGGRATGILRLRFRWTAFATVSNGSLSLGPAFGPSWDLGADQALVVRPPAGYSVDTVRPSTAVDGGVIRYEGPRTFAADQPAVRYVPSGPGTGDGPGGGPSLSVLLGYVAGVGVALVGGGLAVYAWLRRDRLFGDDEPDGDAPAGAETTDGGGPAGTPSGDAGGHGDGAGVDAAAEPDPDAGADTDGTDPEPDTGVSEAVDTGPTGEAGDGDGDGPDPAAVEGAGAGAAAGSGPGSDGQDDTVDPELLSDEERVERLLTENGGRMKQAAIVDETGWSNAKVSQLLSGMAEDGRVEKLRIGRENLISLPDEE